MSFKASSQNWTLSQTNGMGKDITSSVRCFAKSHNKGCGYVIIIQGESEEMGILIQSTILLYFILLCKAE